MSNEHLNAVFDNWKAMECVAYRLRRLGASFEDVGNDRLAGELWDAADEIMTWAARVRDSHGEMLSDQLSRSHEETANMLTAMVAGIDMGRKGKAD